uniref:Protein NRT1/ PTR FAMILY 5.8-like n=1 Tax=Nelumbo nucifera TaxID=4432 RepID=A0A822YUE2_NELNU|nr:TPA_asm: hypothetical protein HUJ06_005355 [Nelumbo nucifera]
MAGVVAGVERFAFKGVASNLVTYLTDVVKLSNSSAAKAINSWCGVTSMLPLLGAFLADSYWDRYSTLLAASFFYVVGLVALTFTALVSSSWSKTSSSVSLFLSLYLISLGQGGYNPCLQAFAADQHGNDDELPCSNINGQNSSRKSLFFQWWYFGICTGSLLGVSLMSYIQDTLGWGLGFAIPTIAMASSVVCFSCSGTRFFIHKQPNDGERTIICIIQSIKATASKIVMNGRITLRRKESKATELELQEKPLCNPPDFGCPRPRNFDTNPANDDQVHSFDDAKALLRLLPIWTMLLMFAVIFQQPSTFFTKQGMTMKRRIGKNFIIPPATLQSAITISIIFLMPLYDKMIIPMIRIISRNDGGVSVMQRMGIGMFLSIIAMVIAALVEAKRLQISRSGLQSAGTAVVPLSIFWLLPQYILLGTSDVFTVVGMQEFFYTQVPSRLRTMGVGLYFSVFGVGSFLSALLISVIEKITSARGENSWFSDDMREARLDKYYWLLAFSSTLSLLFFVSLCKYYDGRK